MFICGKCGSVFTECGTHKEYHPYGMGDVAENWSCCPNCESTEIEEAVKCKACDEWHGETECENDVCDDCTKDIMKRFYSLILNNFDDTERYIIAENVEVDKI